MKNKRFLALILSLAMTLTSFNVNVMAMTSELTATEEILLQDDSAEVEQAAETLISEDESALLTEDGDTLLTSDEPETTDLLNDRSAEGPLADTDVSENTVKSFSPDKREATPFDETATTLTLRKEYSSLREWDYTSVVIPACVTTIPESTDLFVGNEKIKTISFENDSTLTTIEAGAFLNSGIESINLPRSLKEIEASTFQGCRNLRSVYLSNVEVIGDYAFKDCTALTSAYVTGGNRVTEIGQYAFENTGFTTLTLNGMTKGAIAVGEGVFARCLSLVKAELPAGFITVPEKCFEGCNKLTEVKIGSKTVSVETEAFKNCTALKTVDFSNVEAIATKAFDGCSAIETIDLSESVYIIAENAFSKCDKLTKLYIRHYNKKTGYADDMELTGELVYYPGKLTIYGYDGEVEKYATGRNIKYESLSQSHTAKLASGMAGYVDEYWFSKSGSSTTGGTVSAVRGQTVSLRLKTSGWTVINVYDTKDTDQEKVVFKKSIGSGKDILLTFTMPDRDVEVKFDVMAPAALAASSFTYLLTGYDYRYTPVYKDGVINGYETGTTGNKADLVVYAEYGGKSYKLSPWLCSYKSYDNKVITIADGVITAVGAGQCYVSFTPSGAREQAFIITVISEPEIETLEFDKDKLEDEFDDARYGEVGTVTRTFIEEGEPVERTVPIIKFYKSDVASVTRNFDLFLLALDGKGAEINTKASWKIDDTKIAKLANSSNYDNKNVITIQKGISGETNVTASVTVNKVTKYAYAVIQVLNPAPRLTRDSYMVNTQCVYVADDQDESLNGDGAMIEIIASEGYDIDPEAMGQMLYKSEAYNDTETFKGIKVTYIGPSEDHERGYLYRLSIIEGQYGDSNVNTLKEGKSLEYKGKNQLYLRGKYADNNVLDGLSGKYFYIPIKQLTIFNQKLKPTVKQSGSINIFYNSTCYAPQDNDFAGWEEILGDKAKKDVDDEDFEANLWNFWNLTIGEIVISQSIEKSGAEVDYNGVYRQDEYTGNKANKEIKDYVTDIAGDPDAAVRVRLMSEPNYAYFKDNTKAKQKEVKNNKYFDSFANNFIVFKATNGKDFRIRRSANEMAKINGKDVTSGYLLIYYKGYKDPVEAKINLNVKNQGPSYVLSPSSASDTRMNYKTGTGNAIVFQPGLFAKKTGKPILRDDDLADGYPYIDQDKSTRKEDCVFNKEVSITNNYLGTETSVFDIVKNQSYVGKSKAIIHLKRTWWDKELTYTYTISESDKMPTGKFSTSTLGLNKQFVGENTERSITYKVNMGPCTISIDGDPIPLPTRKQEESDFDMLTVSCESEGEGSTNLIVKAYVNDGDIPKGSYKYQINPVATYANDVEVPLKAATFTVSVVDSQPTLKLTGTTYKFNTDFPGVETYKLNATFGSVPKGGKDEKFVLDCKNAKLVPTAREGTTAYNTAMAVKKNFEVTKFEYNEKTKKFDFFCKLGEVDGNYPSFDCAYNLKGLTLDGAEFKPLKVTLKSHHGDVTVIVTGSGSVNTVDPWSQMTIKPTVKNLVNPDIAAITYVEWDEDAGNYVTNDRFQIVKEEDEDKDTTLAYLTATHSKDDKGKDTCTNEDHKVILKYKIGDHSIETAAFNIKPKQTTPTLSADPATAEFYNNSEPGSKVKTIELTKKSVLNAVIDQGTENKGFKVSKRNSEILQRAFEVTYSEVGAEEVPASKYAKTMKAGRIVLTCKAPELLTADKYYDLQLEPEWVGQFEDTTATTVKVRVIVK